ncbi:hypothetical protein BH11PAT2_BH11PAT2_08420 [soil metagenome]
MGFEKGEHGNDGQDSLLNEWGVVIIWTVCLIAACFVFAGMYILESVRTLYQKYIPPLFTLL